MDYFSENRVMDTMNKQTLLIDVIISPRSHYTCTFDSKCALYYSRVVNIICDSWLVPM